MRTLVTFRSAIFNTSKSKDHFINPGCFGDDAAKWLMDELRAKGIETGKEPEQEDFGWYFDFVLPEGKHCLVVGFRPGDDKEEGTWVAWLERSRSFMGSLLGARKRGISSNAVSAIHQALSASSKIRGVRWHVESDFHKSHEDAGSPTP